MKIHGQITRCNNLTAMIEDDAGSTPAKLADANKLQAKATEFKQKTEDIRDE